MDSNITLGLNALSILLGSSLLVAVLNNSRKSSLAHKQLVAEASKSVQKRVEMYFRIRRRSKSESDVLAIRDLFHLIQEENAYYKALLISESKWHGERYDMYISAIQKITGPKLQDAWTAKSFGPNVSITPQEQPDMQRINDLGLQFAKDSRRLMNPILRSWMRIRDSWLVTRLWKITKYDTK